MPIRSRMNGSMDETDLSLLEGALVQLGGDDKSREHFAAMLIRLFQSGITDPDELVRRVRDSS